MKTGEPVIAARFSARSHGHRPERLRLTDLDDDLTRPGHLIEHHAVEELLRQRRCVILALRKREQDQRMYWWRPRPSAPTSRQAIMFRLSRDRFIPTG